MCGADECGIETFHKLQQGRTEIMKSLKDGMIAVSVVGIVAGTVVAIVGIIENVPIRITIGGFTITTGSAVAAVAKATGKV